MRGNDENEKQKRKKTDRLMGSRMEVGRQRAGITPDEIAAKLGIDAATYLEFESGQKRPDPTQLSAIIQFYGVSIRWMFDLNAMDENGSKGLDHDESIQFQCDVIPFPPQKS